MSDSPVIGSIKFGPAVSGGANSEYRSTPAFAGILPPDAILVSKREYDALATRVHELEAALVKYGHHIRNPCTASPNSPCVCGFATILQSTSGAKP